MANEIEKLASDILDVPADIADELENLIEETPADGGELEEIADEIEDELEELAEKLAELSDATAEITAKIVESAKAEKATAKLDEERGDIFDELEDEIYDALPTGRGGAIVVTLLLFGAGVLFMQRFKRNKDARPVAIEPNETKGAQFVDAFGIVHNA